MLRTRGPRAFVCLRGVVRELVVLQPQVASLPPGWLGGNYPSYAAAATLRASVTTLGARERAPALAPQMETTVREARMAIGTVELIDARGITDAFLEKKHHYAPSALSAILLDVVLFNNFKKSTLNAKAESHPHNDGSTAPLRLQTANLSNRGKSFVDIS